MAMVNKIKKGNVEKEIHDSRLPELTGEEGYCVPFVNDAGTAFQIGSIPAACLNTNCVTTEKVADSAITTDKINDGAVTEVKLGEKVLDRLPYGHNSEQSHGVQRLSYYGYSRSAWGEPADGQEGNYNLSGGVVWTHSVYNEHKQAFLATNPSYIILGCKILGFTSLHQPIHGSYLILNEVSRDFPTDNTDDLYEIVFEGVYGGFKYTYKEVFQHMVINGMTIITVPDSYTCKREFIAKTDTIADGAITTDKVANNAITKAKIDSNVASGIADHVVSIACKYIDGEFTDIVVAQDANTLLSWFTSADETVAVSLFVDAESGQTSFILPKVRVYNECGVGGTGTGEVDCDFALVLPNGKTLLEVSFMADLTDGVFDDGDWSITIRNNQVKIGNDDISDGGVTPNKIHGYGAASSASQGDRLALFDNSTQRLKKSVALDGSSNSVLHGDGSFYGKVAGAFNTSSDITVDSYVQEPSYPYEKEGELAQGSFSKLANSESPTIIDDGKVFANTISYYRCTDSSSSVYTFESKDKRLTIHNNDTFELRSTIVYQHYVAATTDIGTFHFSTFSLRSVPLDYSEDDPVMAFQFKQYAVGLTTSISNMKDTPIPCVGWGVKKNSSGESIGMYQFYDFYFGDGNDIGKIYFHAFLIDTDTNTISRERFNIISTLKSFKSFPVPMLR